MKNRKSNAGKTTDPHVNGDHLSQEEQEELDSAILVRHTTDGEFINIWMDPTLFGPDVPIDSTLRASNITRYEVFAEPYGKKGKKVAFLLKIYYQEGDGISVITYGFTDPEPCRYLKLALHEAVKCCVRHQAEGRQKMIADLVGAALEGVASAIENAEAPKPAARKPARKSSPVRTAQTLESAD